MIFSFFLSNPLKPFYKELKKYGFYEITDSLKKNSVRYKGRNVLSMTNNRIVFVFSDRWHDQEIAMQLGTYPFDEHNLMEIEEILLHYHLADKYNYIDMTSYHKQSWEAVVEKQIILLRELLSLL